MKTPSYFLTNNAADSARIAAMMKTSYVLSDAPLTIAVQGWVRSYKGVLLTGAQELSARNILQLPLYSFPDEVGKLVGDEPMFVPPTSIEGFRARNAMWAALTGGFAFLASESSLADFEILRMSTWCAANGLKTVAVIPRDFSGGHPAVLAACDFCIGETNISSLSTLMSTL